MKNFLKEFETFAVKGNALDLAIGVVIGAAFGQITTSLATNVITPPLGLIIGRVNFSELAIPLGGTASIQYGIFLQAILNFIIIAFALFLLVKLINRLTRKKEQEDKKEAQEAKPVESAELAVLKQIRDELAKR